MQSLLSARFWSEWHLSTIVLLPVADLETETFQVNHFGMFLFGLDKDVKGLPTIPKCCLVVVPKALQHFAQLSGRHIFIHVL